MDAAKTGSFIAELRHEKGLTQQQLADRIHVSYKAVSRWETGRGMPDIENLEELSGELGVSVTELLNGKRIEAPIAPEQTEAVVQDSLTLVAQLLHNRSIENALLSFTVGLIFMLLVVTHLTSPQFIPYEYGLVRIDELPNGILIATCSEEAATIDTHSQGDQVFLSCYTTRWNQLTGRKGDNTSIAGTADSVSAVLYYPGVPGAGDVLLWGTLYGFVTTTPRLTYSYLLFIFGGMSVIGFFAFIILQKKWFAPHLLQGAFVPLCFTASIAIVLWGKFDQIYDAGFYLSGVCLMTIALYTLSCLVFHLAATNAWEEGRAIDKVPVKSILPIAAYIELSVFALAILAFSASSRLNVNHVDSAGYPINAEGQAYGPSPGPGHDQTEGPDLILVEGNDGVIGYVYTTDLMGSEPTTVVEAIEDSSGLPHDIPVYESDGTTVIGTFTVGKG